MSNAFLFWNHFLHPFYSEFSNYYISKCSKLPIIVLKMTKTGFEKYPLPSLGLDVGLNVCLNCIRTG